MKLLIIVMLPLIAFAEAKLNINNVLLTGFERHEEHRLETHSTEKRGWASVILYGTSILVRTTSVGLSIAAAVTEGCSYYPSICHDKDAIEDLDKEIQSMKDQFDQMYKKVAQEWVNLRYVSTNNGYINFYVDEAIKHVQNLSDFQSLIVDELKLNVPDLFKIYEASQNLTSETYLEVLIGRLDLQLSDITKMLEEQRDNVLIGLAAQMMIETGLNSFVNSYSNAYKQVRLDQEFESELDAVWTALTKADAADAEILLDQQHPEYEQVMTKYGLKSSKITKTEQVKMAPKVVSKMFQNAKEAGSDALGKLSSWERVKGTIKTKLSSTATKLSETTEFFTSSAALKYQVSNFKMSWSTTIMTSLGIIADAITTAIEIAQWKKVADQMEEAREEYEEYRDNLKAEIENLEAEEANVTEQWKINIELFKELSKVFGELIEKSNNASDFVDVIGLPRSPVSSDNAIMKINFDDINKKNLADTQDVVIQFLRDIDNDLNLVVDQTRALYILYSNIREQTDAGETATEIQSELLDIFNFNPSIIVRDFGNSLQKKDIVCTISILLIHLTEYDYYQLSPFRPDCNVSDSAFDNYEQEASSQRNQGLMRSIVKHIVGENPDIILSQLLGSVQNAYLVSKDQFIVDFGKSISEQDVVCTVAQEFQSMTSFNGIGLTAFRPSCDAVSPEQYADMKNSAEQRNGLLTEVRASLTYCDDFNFCPCMDLMMAQYKATETEIKAAIITIKPSVTQYCGTTGCSCISFVDASSTSM